MTHLSSIPRACQAHSAPEAAFALDRGTTRIATRDLRAISANPDLLMHQPDDTIRDLVDELLAHRATERVRRRRTRLERKSDAVVDALLARYSITGNPKNIRALDPVVEDLLADLRTRGWHDMEERDITQTFRALSENQTVDLQLQGREVPHVGYKLFVHGICGPHQGAAQ